MRLRLNEGQAIAGPDITHAGGPHWDVPELVGAAIVAAGHAEDVTPEPEPDELVEVLEGDGQVDQTETKKRRKPRS